MSRERRLGRGLEALLGRTPQMVEPPIQVPARHDLQQGSAVTNPPHFRVEPSHPEESPSMQKESPEPMPETTQTPSPAEPTSLPSESHGGVIQVDVHLIEPNPYQPRQDFDPLEMRSLADSISAHGLLQPLIVRRKDETYQLIAGERRFRAAQLAGWHEVPIKVVEADDRHVAELAIVENMQRKDLNPLEKAASFQHYLQQYGCSQEELASRLKIDRSTVSNLIRLLELPEPVQDRLRKGRITQGHARALLPLGEEHEQIAFCERIEREGLSVRNTEASVQEMIATADAEPLGIIGRDGKKSRGGSPQSEHVAALEQEFRNALGMKVKLTHNARGRGKLVIHFRNHEEFDRLKRHICFPEPQEHAG